jgi:D-3-phosphoglycerate dehydrogenase
MLRFHPLFSPPEALRVQTSYPKDKIRVVLVENIHPRAAEMLAAEGFRVDTHKGAMEGPTLAAAIAEAHAVGIRSGTRVGAEVLAASPRLLAVGCFCIGTNQVDLRRAGVGGVPVFNSPFSNTRSVAELTVAEVVALHRRMLDQSVRMHRGEWDKSAAGSHEVRGRTLGIVGYGRIGSQVSVLAEAMGMRVVFHDMLAVLPLGNARPARTLDELLGASDVVSLHVPATKATERLIGARQIERMRPGAYLINNARGSVVDIGALAAALKSGRLGGAALDVFPDEPAAAGETFQSELRGLGNVILTPHVGGSTEEAQGAIAEDVAGKLIKYINNGSTTAAVNVPQVELPEQGLSPSMDAEAEASGAERTPRRHRILHFHQNVPGVLSKMHGIIAELGANIAAEYLQTNADIGYVVLDVDPTDAARITERLRGVPETVRVRMLW